MHNKNLIRMLDRGQSMRDHDRGSTGHQALQCFLNPLLCLGINVRCRLIENEDLRIMRQRSCKGQQLSLSLA